MRKKTIKAFTAIEVVVIIIVTSFLLMFLVSVQELNRSNNVKILIAQIAQFDKSMGGFYDKYNALPGDVKFSINFGLSNNDSSGNGNGIIEDRNGNINSASGEVTNFWMHLSKANFLSQNFDGQENENAKIGTTFPISKINTKRGITVFGYNYKNYYQIGVVGANSKNIITSDNSLKVSESFAIDIKIDDGLAKSGRVIVVGGDNVNGIDEDSKCVLNQEYNTKIKMPNCQIRIEFNTVG